MAGGTDKKTLLDITNRIDVPLFSAQQHLDQISNHLIYHQVGEGSVNQVKPVPGYISQHSSTKVAISRLPRPAIETSKSRVGRACDPCREQKAKCSGRQPRCQRCHATGAICVYTDGKRAREAKSG
jgi:hypothetical protein